MEDREELMRRLEVRWSGNDRSRRTLVFSHGFGTNLTEWKEVAAGLADEFRILSFNYPGASGSDPQGFDRKRHSSLVAFAHDLVALAEAVGLEEAVLVGRSAGATIGLLAATLAPERFRRLVLIGASARYLNDGDYVGGFTHADLQHLTDLMATDYDQWVGQFVPLVTRQTPGDPLHDYLSLMLQGLDPEVASVLTRTVLESDHREWLPLVTQPTLLLHAREDPVVPDSAAEYVRRNIADCRLQRLAARGHFPTFDAPEELVAAIRAFAAE